MYRFLDREAKGELDYDAFTLLSEERWRNLDPYQQYQESVEKHRMAKHEKPESNVYSSATGRADSETN